MRKFPLASSTWDEKEINAIQKVIASDMYSMGKEVFAYEKEFAEFFGSNHAVMVSSGSAANLLMIAALFYSKNKYLQRGDEIIVPAVSWSTTYFPLQQYGLKVKFVDINRDTLNINIDDLEQAISPNTKAIFLVNLLGNPNDFDRIQKIADQHGIFVIEDNCESMGATYHGKQAGTFGLMGSFSSFFSHHIATMEGGCVLTDDEELYHVMLCIRAHGWTRNLPKVNHVTGEKSDDAFEESFKFVLPGYNLRPLEMSGAIGREQLIKLPSFIEQRRKNAQAFCAAFSEFDFIKIQKEVGESSWFGFSMLILDHAPFSRKELIALFNEKQIECRPIVSGNFLKNKEVLQYFNYEAFGQAVNAEFVDSNGLFVGNHQIDLSQEIDYLVSTIRSLIK